MAILKTKVSLYLQENSTTWDNEKNNFELRNKGDGTNDYIHTWEVQGVLKPTQAQLDALDAQADEYETNLRTTKENNKASAKQKLQDLGLTVDEIKEAFGI
jgi:hypothetical protein